MRREGDERKMVVEHGLGFGIKAGSIIHHQKNMLECLLTSR